MLQKTLTAIVGLVALATATVVAILAVAFALFAVLTPLITAAGAAAIVAGVFALIVAIVALVVAGGSRHQGYDEDHHGGSADFGLVERLFEMARERPLLSVGAAIAAGVIAIRNPALVATIAAAFIDRPKHKK